MVRFLVVLLGLISGALSAQTLPVPQRPDTPAALDPVLHRAAELFAERGDWKGHLAERGGHVDGDRLLFEIAEFGQRTPVGGPWPNEGPSISERLAGLAEAFRTLEWIPSGSSTFQRGWIRPDELTAFHREVLGALPVAATSRWMPPVATGFGNVSSEGPPNMFADHFHDLGTRGAGIKIAVFDVGFYGITSFAAAEVGAVETHPNQPLSWHALHPQQQAHGTACVEIIRDMAPEARILIIDESDPFMPTSIAVNYAISWGADIISRSLGGYGYPEADASTQAAVAAANAGIHFVNAAGNNAQRYWENDFYSVGSGGYVNFTGTSQLNRLAGLPPYTMNTIDFSYERPDASYASFEVDLYADYGSGLFLLESGNGSATMQLITYQSQPGVTYYVGVWQASPGTLGRLRLTSIWASLMSHGSPYGSVMNPATSPAVISVGAVSQTRYGSAIPESYSSRGGGIFNLPLTVCAPTDCSTVSYGPQAFAGTSCACPNFAGFLALHLARPEYAADPFDYMFPFILNPTWNPDTGYGIAYALVSIFEPNSTPGQAIELGSSSTIADNHMLAPANDEDWFKFTLTSPADVVLETAGSYGDTGITLYDSAMSQIGYDDDSGDDLFSLLIMPHLPAGTYYVRVDVPLQDTIAFYELSLAITRDVPTLVDLLTPTDAVTDEPSPVAASWTEAGSISAATYLVEVARDDAFNNIVATESALTATDVTIKGLRGNTTYWWRVRAENPYGPSPWSTAWSFTTLATPKSGGGGKKDSSGCALSGTRDHMWIAAAVALAALLHRRRTLKRRGPTLSRYL